MNIGPVPADPNLQLRLFAKDAKRTSYGALSWKGEKTLSAGSETITWTYALRRGLKPYDRRTVESIHRAVAADGYHFRTLVHQIVKSLPFQARRGEDITVAGGPR